ncbi:MAG: hypothetical protein FJX76_13125 [Armatimonadetes bacterium]|nr:hypothetical protein [Armatimonadota bacterium]
MARFCGKCGSAASEKATFCNKCGGRLLQKSSIRYSYEDNARPANPYQGQATEAPAEPAPSGRNKAVGVQPAVHSAGRKEAPKRTPAAPKAPAAATPYTPPSADTERPLFAALEEDPVTRARASVRNFSLWAAGIVLMPIPFGDLVLLIPVQSAMVLSVARIFGVQDPPEKILAYIAATSGVSVFGQVTMLIVANLFPIVGKLVSAPFIYGWTYGLGEVSIRYFQSQGQITGEEMKAVFKQASSSAHKAYSKEKKVNKDEAMDNLRDHLPQEEYDRLRSKFGTT